jgi:hypothetical protein
MSRPHFPKTVLLYPINWRKHKDQKISRRYGEHNTNIKVLVAGEKQFFVCLAYKLVNTHYIKTKVEYDKHHNAVEHKHNHTITRKEQGKKFVHFQCLKYMTLELVLSARCRERAYIKNTLSFD